MSTYAIGDIQGCFESLQKLLEHINFNKNTDQLWFAGDLVNRGPQSLEVLRFIKSLDDSAKIVLGNHDLHFLAVAMGCQTSKKYDTFADVINAPDKVDLINWLLTKSLLHYDKNVDCIMVHAGIYPGWNLLNAQQYALEAVKQLKARPVEFFNNMYGNTPNTWSENLSGWDRIRFITNTFTRMRYCEKKERPALEFSDKGTPSDKNSLFIPWLYHARFNIKKTHIVFGHWSTFGFSKSANITALDTGCLWGGRLTALEIETKKIYSVSC